MQAPETLAEATAGQDDASVTETAENEQQPAETGVPAAEAFAHAMAVTNHQHAAAQPEDARPVRLPFPRPAFDFAAAFHRIREKRAEVKDLARVFEGAQYAMKRAKTELEEADGELKTLLDELAEDESDEAQERAEAGEQLALHGPECSYERANPGRVCGICAESRERARAAAESDGPGLPARNDETLRDILLLVDRDIPLETIAGWSDDDYRHVEGWAGAAHLAASDNRIHVPPLPTVLGGHHQDDEELAEEAEFEPAADPVVGSIAVAMQDLMSGCAEGERAVCYEVDRIDGHASYGFIFAGGWYDGFSPDEVREYLTLTGEVCEALTGYRFTNVRKLSSDHRKGVFAAAFEVEAGR